MKITKNEKNLIAKINRNKDAILDKNEIVLALSKWNHIGCYEMKGEKECLEKYISLIKHNKLSRDVAVCLFNKFCKVEPWFNYVSEPDGGEWINEKDPFAGFAIIVKFPTKFKETLKSYCNMQNKDLER